MDLKLIFFCVFEIEFSSVWRFLEEFRVGFDRTRVKIGIVGCVDQNGPSLIELKLPEVKIKQ